MIWIEAVDGVELEHDEEEVLTVEALEEEYKETVRQMMKIVEAWR